MSGRLRLKEPAGDLRLRERGASRQQSKVRNGGRSDEHDGENVGVLLYWVATWRTSATATPAAILAATGPLMKAPRLSRVTFWLVITWTAPVTISQPVAPRKPPITGYGTKADGAPCAREAEHPKDCSGHRGGQRQRDEGWAEQPRAAMGEQIVRQGSHERRQHHGDGTVRAGDRKRQRTAPGDDRGTNGGRKERHRYAVGERVFERPGEDERRFRTRNRRSTGHCRPRRQTRPSRRRGALGYRARSRRSGPPVHPHQGRRHDRGLLEPDRDGPGDPHRSCAPRRRGARRRLRIHPGGQRRERTTGRSRRLRQPRSGWALSDHGSLELDERLLEQLPPHRGQGQSPPGGRGGRERGQSPPRRSRSTPASSTIVPAHGRRSPSWRRAPNSCRCQRAWNRRRRPSTS